MIKIKRSSKCYEQISIKLLSIVLHNHLSDFTLFTAPESSWSIKSFRNKDDYLFIEKQTLKYKKQLSIMKIASLSILSGLAMGQGYGSQPAGTVFTDLLFKSLMDCQEWINEVSLKKTYFYLLID